VELRSRDAAEPLTTADGSTIRPLLGRSNAPAGDDGPLRLLCACAPPYRHGDTFS
jgi:hypothetical protein